MNDNEKSRPAIIGKPVKDMYGSHVGNAIGIITDIDGTVKSVGVDCEFRGLLELLYEHLIVQEDTVIYMPKWRLDSQKVLWEKSLIIRRLKALARIISEDDSMKEHSNIVQEGYEQKLENVNKEEALVKEDLEKRLSELRAQSKSAKSLLLEAAMQYRNSEIPESNYKSAKNGTTSILERIRLEINEIESVQKRLDELVAEETDTKNELVAEETKTKNEPVTIPPEAPMGPPGMSPQTSIPEPPSEQPRSDWLTRMSSQ